MGEVWWNASSSRGTTKLPGRVAASSAERPREAMPGIPTFPLFQTSKAAPASPRPLRPQGRNPAKAVRRGRSMSDTPETPPGAAPGGSSRQTVPPGARIPSAVRRGRHTRTAQTGRQARFPIRQDRPSREPMRRRTRRPIAHAPARELPPVISSACGHSFDPPYRRDGGRRAASFFWGRGSAGPRGRRGPLAPSPYRGESGTRARAIGGRWIVLVRY